MNGSTTPRYLQGSRSGSLLHLASEVDRVALCGATIATPRKKPQPSLGRGVCPKCEAKAAHAQVSGASATTSEDRRRLQKPVVNPGGMHCVCKCGCRAPSGIMQHCCLCRAGCHLPAMPDSRGR